MTVKNENAAMFGLIAQAGDIALRASMFANLAALRSVAPSVLEAEFAIFAEENAKKLASEVKQRENTARKARVDILAKECEGLTLDSEDLGDLISRVNEEGGVVALTPDLELVVTLEMPKAHKGGTGKPPAWRPAAFRDSAGDRVFGALTDWAKNNLSEAEQKASGCFRPNGKFRSGASMGAALVKSGDLVVSAVSAEEMAEARAKAEAAKAAK